MERQKLQGSSMYSYEGSSTTKRMYNIKDIARWAQNVGVENKENNSSLDNLKAIDHSSEPTGTYTSWIYF